MSKVGDRKEISVYRFIVDGKPRRRTTTCSLCSSLVLDPDVHALFHHRRGEKPPEQNNALLSLGTYNTGLITVKLDYYGRIMR